MHMTKADIPIKFAVPGATARQLPDFGDATGFGAIAGEFFSLGAGTTSRLCSGDSTATPATHRTGVT